MCIVLALSMSFYLQTCPHIFSVLVTHTQLMSADQTVLRKGVKGGSFLLKILVFLFDTAEENTGLVYTEWVK